MLKEVKLVRYAAPWCRASQAQESVLEGVLKELRHHVRCKLDNRDYDNDPPEAALNVYGLPTLIAYVDGKEYGRIVGYCPADEIHSLLRRAAS